MHRKAIRHLRENDPTLAGLIDRIGPCRLKPQTDLSHFESVARAIVFQQLSGKAAATIHGRFAGLFPDQQPTPTHLLTLEDGALRTAGLSRPKVKYLRDLASRVTSNELPIDTLHEFADDEILGHLTRVKGVGVWTAQMFLLFRLGRPDVLPDLDLGIQKAVQLAYRLRKRPTPERVRTIGAKWAPFRSVATWYLWRSID